ncbi:type IV pilus modification protein PilV [Delftia tsuruhatensis]
MPFPSRRQRGAGLIEVLVAVLLVAVGLLGAVRIHVRAIEYTVDTERRQMASMLASELLETLRGTRPRSWTRRARPWRNWAATRSWRVPRCPRHPRPASLCRSRGRSAWPAGASGPASWCPISPRTASTPPSP